jgi:hypothetical protein
MVFVGGIVFFLGVAIAVAIAEWRASEDLVELLRAHSGIIHSEPSSSSSL